MTDARSLLREATVAELKICAALYRDIEAGPKPDHGGPAPSLAAAALSLVAEGRESGAFTTAAHYVDGADSLTIGEARRQVVSLKLLKALAGEP